MSTTNTNDDGIQAAHLMHLAEYLYQIHQAQFIYMASMDNGHLAATLDGKTCRQKLEPGDYLLIKVPGLSWPETLPALCAFPLEADEE